LEILFIRKKNFRNEDNPQEIFRQRGRHPRLVCIFSALETLRQLSALAPQVQRENLLAAR
jgi:hypothetical protein